MVMPEMSGIEVLKHIKQMDPEAVVVMLTSMASRENVLKSKKAGAFAYVLKPFKIREIKEVVKEIRSNSAQ
jgi:DNA-binding NtrC family response regulator